MEAIGVIFIMYSSAFFVQESYQLNKVCTIIIPKNATIVLGDGRRAGSPGLSSGGRYVSRPHLLQAMLMLSQAELVRRCRLRGLTVGGNKRDLAIRSLRSHGVTP